MQKEKRENDLVGMNQFIRYADELMYAYDKDKEHIETAEEVSYGKQFLWFKYDKKITKREEISTANRSEIRKEIKEFIDKNTSEPLSFKFLWQYCQFVRWAEKTVFYKNTTDNKLFVDSAMMDLDKRNFVLSYGDDILIQFSLEKQKDPVLKYSTFDIPDPTEDRSVYYHVIKINVVRKYGKMMNNKYTIIDSRVNYEDSSDITLMDTINKLLCEAVRNECTYIYDLIDSDNYITNLNLNATTFKVIT